MSSVNLVSGDPPESTCGRSLDHKVFENVQKSSCWEPSDWDPSTSEAFIVLVAECGRQILIRREGDVISAVHDFRTSETSYEEAQRYREEVCSYFGISAHTCIVVNVCLKDFIKDYSYGIKILEVTDDTFSEGAAIPFVWIDWRAAGLDFDRSCPHSHIGRFLVSYLSNKHIEEINLATTPWRRLGFYNTAFHSIEQLVSDAGYEMNGSPEQVHWGSLSTIYKIPTTQGFLFFKIGVKGNGEPKRTKVITDMFPDATPRMLGQDADLEMMISEDHGPSLNNLYCVIRSNRPALDDTELKLLFGAALTEWARLQKESIDRTEKLSANGIPLYDIQWIRNSFSQLTTYMKETELDKAHPKVLGFGTQMERTFKIWERFNLPYTLVHGDLSEANIAQPRGLGTKFIFFDWDSVFIGHPFLDLACNETMDISLGEDAYLECWKEYGDVEALRKVALWTRPVHYVVEAVCEIHKRIWTAKERRLHVEYRLESLIEAREECHFETDRGILGI